MRAAHASSRMRKKESLIVERGSGSSFKLISSSHVFFTSACLILGDELMKMNELSFSSCSLFQIFNRTSLVPETSAKALRNSPLTRGTTLDIMDGWTVLIHLAHKEHWKCGCVVYFHFSVCVDEEQ